MSDGNRNSNPNRCLLDDDEDDEIPCEWRERLAYYARRFKGSLPKLIPYILVAIAAVLIAYFIQSLYNNLAINDIKAEVAELRDSLNCKLEDIEKALTRLAISCNSYNNSAQSEEEDIEDPVELKFKKLLRKYDADKTGMIDWALESLGGKIVSVKSTESYLLSSSSILGIPCTKHSSDPASIIRPSTNPGDCWAFKGEGNAVVKLISPIYVTNFTLEHIAKEMSPDGEMSSAPKIFVVLGCPDDSCNTGHSFGHYEYKCDGDTVQTFPVQYPSYSPYDTVEFSFKTNYGNKDFTCVYRIRVHGQLTMDGLNCNKNSN